MTTRTTTTSTAATSTTSTSQSPSRTPSRIPSQAPSRAPAVRTVLQWAHEPLLALTVRDLLRRLATVEDALRELRQRDGRTPEGEQAQLEHYARRLCEELRRRRR